MVVVTGPRQVGKELPIMIDEIQKAPELLPFIKVAADEAQENGLFWLTGSQPFHLMRHAPESLAGRAGIIKMLGLSNAEIARVPSEPFAPGPDKRTVGTGTIVCMAIDAFPLAKNLWAFPLWAI